MSVSIKDQIKEAMDRNGNLWAGFYNITATLTEDTEMSVWNHQHGDACRYDKHVAVAGTRVLLWVCSRFGDIGITDNLNTPWEPGGACGYSARVSPVCACRSGRQRSLRDTTS